MGKSEKRSGKWLEQMFDGSMLRLAKEYCAAPIVIYSGAGVSVGSRDDSGQQQYGIPIWSDLLRAIAGKSGSSNWPSDPWKAADKAVACAGGNDAFRDRLLDIVRHPSNYTQNNGAVASAFLNSAPTLRAVAAFTGRLTARLTNPKITCPSKVSFRSEANPRVHAVLTSNYDCFLESAGSTLYRRSPLRPVTALGSPAASATRIPVFHVHGYVPHPFYQYETRSAAVEKLVITANDYEEAWQLADVFGSTMGPQIHLLRYYTALFIGFSFSDRFVNQLLRRINKDYLSYSGRTHFALVRSEEVKKRGRQFFVDLGVAPIEIDGFSEIPDRLGELYSAGLIADNIRENQYPNDFLEIPELLVRTHRPSGWNYSYPATSVWQIVQSLRNEATGRKFVQRLGERRIRKS